MFSFRQATTRDKDVICRIDATILGDTRRAEEICQAIDSGQCYTVSYETKVSGFAIMNQSFFRQAFLSLLSVHPAYQRKGLGETLLFHLEEICPTEKLFLTTRLSNKPMQNLCRKLGYLESGIIHNLNPNEPEILFCKKIKNAALS